MRAGSAGSAGSGFPFSSLAPCLGLLLLLLSSVPRTARAQTPIIDFTGGTGAPIASALTAGFDFTLTGTQTITGLGVFDFGADGLANAHTVGVWNSAGNLLTSVVVTTANSTPVVSTSSFGNYRRVSVAPLVLSSGTYTLGATYATSDADAVVYQATASNSAGVFFGTNRYSPGASLTRPTLTSGTGIDAAYFGPMAFTGASGAGAPEPATLPLLGMGLTLSAGMVGTVKRRKAKPRTKQAA